MQHFISGLRGLVTFRQWCTSEPSWVAGVRVEEVRSWWSAPPLVSHSGSSRQGSAVFFRTASLTGKVSCSPHRFRTYCLAITAGRQDVLLWNEIYSKVKKEWCKTRNPSRYFCLTFFFFFFLALLHFSLRLHSSRYPVLTSAACTITNTPSVQPCSSFGGGSSSAWTPYSPVIYIQAHPQHRLSTHLWPSPARSDSPQPFSSPPPSSCLAATVSTSGGHRHAASLTVLERKWWLLSH